MSPRPHRQHTQGPWLESSIINAGRTLPPAAIMAGATARQSEVIYHMTWGRRKLQRQIGGMLRDAQSTAAACAPARPETPTTP